MKDNRFQLGYRTPLVVRLYNSIKANLTESRATFFNPHPFPAKEFDEAAFFHCVDEETSRLFCPNRWKVIQAWIESTTKVDTCIFFLSDSLFTLLKYYF